MGKKPAHTKVPGLLQGVKQEGIGQRVQTHQHGSH